MCLTEKNRAVYLDGLKKLMERGVAITINGKKATGRMLHGLLITDGNSFYYGSFIENPATGLLEQICFDSHNQPVERRTS